MKETLDSVETERKEVDSLSTSNAISFVYGERHEVLPWIFPSSCLSNNARNGVCPFDFRQRYTDRGKKESPEYLTCFLLSLESLLFRGCYVEFVRDSLFHATVIKWTKENVKKRKRKKNNNRLRCFPSSEAASFATAIVLHCTFFNFFPQV